MEWIADQYDVFQKSYQFENGQELIAVLEKSCDLSGKSLLDLGCGNGDLSMALKERVGESGKITAVDRDAGMLSVFRSKPESTRINIYQGDLLQWLESTAETFQIVFSNAVLHWLGSLPRLEQLFAGIYKVLEEGGHMAIRFSLAGNCEESKLFLERQLRRFLGNEEITVFRSQYHFEACQESIVEKGFLMQSAQELSFRPFSGNDEKDFYWMLRSQPILNYLKGGQLEAFSDYLYQVWQQQPVRVNSHHAIFVAQKSKKV